jgi:hypothetical protein
MSRERDERALGTADLVASAEAPQAQQVETMRETSAREAEPQKSATTVEQHPQGEQLAALFTPDVAEDFRSRWDDVQISFVDDPKRAVQLADELVAQVMKSLAESFARQRSSIEAEVSGGEQVDTENLRVALRSYRSFFQRLLSL